MNKAVVRAIFSLIVLAAMSAARIPALAQETGTQAAEGGVFIAIDDGNPRQCINVTRSVTSIYLVAVKSEMNNSSFLPRWLAETTNVGVKANITLIDPKTQNPVFTFPRAVKLRPVGSTNIITLPIVSELLTKFSFMNNSSQPPSPLANVSIDLDFINIKGGTPLAVAMLSLISFTEDLPIPPNPYVPGVQLFGQFANTLIHQASAGNGDDSPVAKISYDLATTDSCKSRELTEGTTGIIFDPKKPDTKNTIATSEATNYCYFKEQEPGSAVTYLKKLILNQTCEQQAVLIKKSALYGTRVQLNNPQIVIAVNSYATRTDVASKAKVVRKKPVCGPVASSRPVNAGQAAIRLEAYYNAEDPNELQTTAENMTAWSDELKCETGKFPVSEWTDEDMPGDWTLPASTAAQYDSARASARCAINGIPENKCDANPSLMGLKYGSPAGLMQIMK
jgi:hypothetical protein